MRGYFGIGIYHSKYNINIGTLWRSAKLFGANFIFTIGQRYKHQSSDTMKADKHLPLFEYKTYKEFQESLPSNCNLVFIEQTNNAKNIKDFIHPEQAIYILGAEDTGIPKEIMKGHQKVFIDTERSLNVAVAGSIIMFDRVNKS